MALWIDLKYLRQISYRIDGFKEKKPTPYLAYCRCPLCGDSQKSTRKRRGGFFERGGNLYYKCFNCMADEALHFSQFLKDFDGPLYSNYRLDQFKETVDHTRGSEEPVVKKEEIDYGSLLKTKTSKHIFFNDADNIMSLPKDHPARSYLEDRKIPVDFMKEMYFTTTFYKWASGNTDRFVYVESESDDIKDHARIIIPWYDHSGEIMGYSARAISKENDPKYYMIVLNENEPKLYGMHRLDKQKPIYVVEGPVDSMFLPNAVAVGSAGLTAFEDDGLDVTYCWDNEKRNEDIVKYMTRALKNGKKIFIPPDTYQPKDINDAILKGISSSDIIDMIRENTYQGLGGLARMMYWAKIRRDEPKKTFKEWIK